MNPLQQFLYTLQWLQVRDKASLYSYSDLNKQGPFIYPLGEPISSDSHKFPHCSDGAISS